MTLLLGFLLSIHVIVSLLMILVVLMQRPRSEGLGAAFGGGMTDNIFGAQTTHVLAKATTWLGGAFFALTLILAMLFARTNTTASAIQRELLAEPAPVLSDSGAESDAAESPVVEETIVVEPAASEGAAPAEIAPEPAVPESTAATEESPGAAGPEN